MATGRIQLSYYAAFLDQPKDVMVQQRCRNIGHTAVVLPDYYVLTQLPVTPGSQRQHRVLRAPEESSVAFPFLLTEHAVLVQIHSIESFEDFPVVDLISGEFSVLI